MSPRHSIRPSVPGAASDLDPSVALAEALAFGSSIRGVKKPPMPAVGWHDATRAETRFEGSSAQVLFVQGSDRYQIMRQAGHEAAHVLSGGQGSNWAHEMAAEVMSLEFLKHKRHFEYAVRCQQDLARSVGEGSIFGQPYDFGKCYGIGRQLLTHMKPRQLLAVLRFEPTDEGLSAWLADLPPPIAASARDAIAGFLARERAGLQP
jgi:hypothetical protein